MSEEAVAVIHFVGRLTGDDAGAVFDTSDIDVALEAGIYHDHRDYAPVTFQLGENAMLPGIEAAVREMEPGDTRTVRLDPEDAFGPRREDRVIEVSRAELEARSDTTATEGDLVGSDLTVTDEISTANDTVTGWITDVRNDTVEIDFNHELAGEPVEFEIRLLSLDPDDEDC